MLSSYRPRQARSNNLALANDPDVNRWMQESPLGALTNFFNDSDIFGAPTVFGGGVGTSDIYPFHYSIKKSKVLISPRREFTASA